ncbi:MAG: LysM peptidoglycan-binding domain-containing protein [Bacteroidia bacterium]|jgi:LysM repeat protein|nr:LysM peptidoglycan-binding domain-containing protein [Bacteroidia bacterium]
MKVYIIIICLFFSGTISAKVCDSLKVEVIKGQKFIIHKLDKNETLIDLIKRYKVTLVDINKCNEFKRGQPLKGQLIRIPLPVEVVKLNKPLLPTDSTKGVDEAHANAQGAEQQKIYTHVVTSQDNINSISKKYKITPQQLIKWNNLKSNKVVAGQMLIVDESMLIKPHVSLNSPQAAMPQQATVIPLATQQIVTDSGFAAVEETYQVLHATSPPGTFIRIVNEENGRECIVKVTGVLDKDKYKNFIIIIGKENEAKLGLTSLIARVKLYYLKP